MTMMRPMVGSRWQPSLSGLIALVQPFPANDHYWWWWCWWWCGARWSIKTLLNRKLFLEETNWQVDTFDWVKYRVSSASTQSRIGWISLYVRWKSTIWWSKTFKYNLRPPSIRFESIRSSIWPGWFHIYHLNISKAAKPHWVLYWRKRKDLPLSYFQAGRKAREGCMGSFVNRSQWDKDREEWMDMMIQKASRDPLEHKLEICIFRLEVVSFQVLVSWGKEEFVGQQLEKGNKLLGLLINIMVWRQWKLQH